MIAGDIPSDKFCIYSVTKSKKLRLKPYYFFSKLCNAKQLLPEELCDSLKKLHLIITKNELQPTS